MSTIKLQVLMRYRIPFNFMFQLLIQSAFSHSFNQVKKTWKYGAFFFVTILYIANLMKMLWGIHYTKSLVCVCSFIYSTCNYVPRIMNHRCPNTIKLVMSFINDLSFCKLFDIHEIIVFEAELFLRPYLPSYLLS